MGKTVEVLGLIMATLPELKERVEKHQKAKTTFDGDSYYSAESSDSDSDEYVAHTTLIIVPPALLAQWLHEIEKAVGKRTLTVSMLVAQNGKLVPCLPPREQNGHDVIELSDDDDVDDWDRVQASDIIVTTYASLDKKCCSRVLQTVQWGRVVLDEMQEIRSSTTQIAKNCEKLQCDRRWMLSGTPIFQGVGDLRGELNFLRLEPFGANLEDGFFKFAIQDPWDRKEPRAVEMLRTLGLVALRRSKDMTVAETGTALLDLKPLTVEFIPVEQTPSERALYCFIEYLVACELQQANRDKKNNKIVSRIAIWFPELPGGRTGSYLKAAAKSRALCLRLLRETCITPMLLNGGLGVPSQLAAIDKLMTSHHRREQFKQPARDDDGCGARKRAGKIPVMSCERAQRFLTQHTDAARTDDDFVTDVAFGGGRGVSNRDRATESAEEKCVSAREKIVEAEKLLADASKKRATARWHWALEKITSGAMNGGGTFSGLWKWRRIVYLAMKKQARAKKTPSSKKAVKISETLVRGWRPSPSFVKDLHKRRPDFAWAQPHSLLAINIPKEVTPKELATAVRESVKLVPSAGKEQAEITTKLSELLESKNKSKKAKEEIKELQSKLEDIEGNMDEYKRHDLKVPTVTKVRGRKHVKGAWKAIIHFDNTKDAHKAMGIFNRANGFPLATRRAIPHITALKKHAEEKVAQMEAEFKVHPSSNNRLKHKEAEKELAEISLGLRLCTESSKASKRIEDETIREEAGTGHAHVIVEKALGRHRAVAKTSVNSVSALEDSVEEIIQASNVEFLRQKGIVAKENRVLKKLSSAFNSQVSEKTQQLSAYETLEILAEGDIETTECCICLGHLGSEEHDDEVEGAVAAARRFFKKSSPAKKHKSVSISMIKCGHLFCTKCITDQVHNHVASNMSIKCPVCRKEFNLGLDTVQVDPSLKDEREARKKEREAAKELVREASILLEESHGHLDAQMWRALYLAFDLPTNVSQGGSQKFPAIDREFLAHLRSATSMPINCMPRDNPAPGSVKGAGRCSKIQKLLEDLSTKERCVIFSSNKNCLMHLRTILREDKIGCQAIYTGQSTDDLKSAVSKWEEDGEKATDPPPYPCLLVQAGAAAAGLTLTAASKMFIMEPFLRQEEEKQAYARCHRYSQKHKVSVKVYYTPVSVESRLLEWRQGAKKALVGSEKDDGDDLGNYEKDTKIVFHDMAEGDSDEEAEEEDEDASYAGNSDDENSGSGNDDDEKDDKNHDVAQAEFLLCLND